MSIEVNKSHKTVILLPNAWGYNWATLFQGKINTGTWLSRLWESQI
jgi:hypothetical protein